MKSLKLDPITHKLIIPFEFVSGADKVRQDIQVTLLTRLGEWFLDNRRGIDYKNKIWVKNKPGELQKIKTYLKSKILEVRDVLSIPEFSISTSIDEETQKTIINVSFIAISTFGQIEIEENLKNY